VIVAVYADGGVIRKNPSPFGLTWAWCSVDENDERVIERYGYVRSPNGRLLTNNHAEQIAITLALEAMPDGWSGTVASDSMVALGRVLKNWRTRNLPDNITVRSRAAVARLGPLKELVLQGHPTKKELIAGWGKRRDLPVSIHNVWCDRACHQAAEDYENENRSDSNETWTEGHSAEGARDDTTSDQEQDD
jgi:ribonuclease HI